MGKTIDKTGETGINNFGSEMVIIKYNNAHDIDVYFPKYDWTVKGVQYDNFKKGLIKCPYEKRYYGVGYLGEGNYKVSENGKLTKCYDTWHHMLERCYSEKFHEKHSTYKDCTVCEEWYNFQNFAKWYEVNYYEAEGERMHLDKDILCKGNKIYSPENCVFVPQTINSLFVKSDKARGESVIGISYHKASGKFQANCRVYDYKENKSKPKHLGLYDTQEKAFEVYKYYKEKNIKEVADYYFRRIPKRLYNAMYSYEVEIDD